MPQSVEVALRIDQCLDTPHALDDVYIDHTTQNLADEVSRYEMKTPRMKDTVVLGYDKRYNNFYSKLYNVRDNEIENLTSYFNGVSSIEKLKLVLDNYSEKSGDCIKIPQDIEENLIADSFSKIDTSKNNITFLTGHHEKNSSYIETILKDMSLYVENPEMVFSPIDYSYGNTKKILPSVESSEIKSRESGR